MHLELELFSHRFSLPSKDVFKMKVVPPMENEEVSKLSLV